MFFLNAEIIADKIRTIMETHANIKTMVLDLRSVFDLEYSALKMLVDSEHRQRESGVQFLIAAPNAEVRGMLMRSRLGEELGPENIFDSLDMAVAHYLKLYPVAPISSQKLLDKES